MVYVLLPVLLRVLEGSDYDEPAESPTYALAEILQALEIEGLTPDYYVGHANSLVESIQTTSYLEV